MPCFSLPLHSLFFSWRFEPHFYRGCCVVVLFVVLRAPGTTQFAQLHGHVSRLDFSPVAPIFPRLLQGRFFPRSKVLRAPQVSHGCPWGFSRGSTVVGHILLKTFFSYTELKSPTGAHIESRAPAEALCPGKKTALQRPGEKSERPEKNRGAKRSREVGQTVLSLGREAPRTKRPCSSRGKNGARSATKKNRLCSGR